MDLVTEREPSPEPASEPDPSPIPGPPGEPSTSCDRFASPSGSDSAAGTLDAPYATPAKLVASLDPGEVGCLRDNCLWKSDGSDGIKSDSSFFSESGNITAKPKYVDRTRFDFNLVAGSRCATFLGC